MRLITPAVRILFPKELRQLLRNRQALMSAGLMPVLLLVVLPAFQVFGAGSLRNATGGARTGSPVSPRELIPLYLLPLFVCLAGVLAPSVTAVASIVSEREKRTVELLVALPVRVTEVVTAKLLATLAAIAVVTVPLTVLDGVGAVLLLGQPVAYAPLLLAVLLCGMIASICFSAVIALIARDYRTSQQLSGLLVVPLLLVANGVLLIVPGLVRLLLLALILGVGGGLAAWVVVRRVSFERYLG